MVDVKVFFNNRLSLSSFLFSFIAKRTGKNEKFMEIFFSSFSFFSSPRQKNFPLFSCFNFNFHLKIQMRARTKMHVSVVYSYFVSEEFVEFVLRCQGWRMRAGGLLDILRHSLPAPALFQQPFHPAAYEKP